MAICQSLLSAPFTSLLSAPMLSPSAPSFSHSTSLPLLHRRFPRNLTASASLLPNVSHRTFHPLNNDTPPGCAKETTNPKARTKYPSATVKGRQFEAIMSVIPVHMLLGASSALILLFSGCPNVLADEGISLNSSQVLRQELLEAISRTYADEDPPAEAGAAVLIGAVPDTAPDPIQESSVTVDTPELFSSIGKEDGGVTSSSVAPSPKVEDAAATLAPVEAAPIETKAEAIVVADDAVTDSITSFLESLASPQEPAPEQSTLPETQSADSEAEGASTTEAVGKIGPTAEGPLSEGVDLSASSGAFSFSSALAFAIPTVGLGFLWNRERAEKASAEGKLGETSQQLEHTKELLASLKETFESEVKLSAEKVTSLNNEARKEISNLSEKLTKEQLNAKQLQEELRVVQQSALALRGETERQKVEIAEKEGAKSLLEESLERTLEVSQNLQQELSVALKASAEKSDEISGLQRVAEMRAKNVEELKEKLRVLEEEVAAGKKEIEEKVGELRGFVEAVGNVKSALVQSESRVRALEEEVRGGIEREKGLEGELRGVKGELEEARAETRGLKEVLAVKENELEKAENKIIGLIKSVEDLQAEVDTAVGDLNVRREEAEQLRGSIEGLEGELKSSREEVREATEKATGVEREKEEKEKEITELKGRLETEQRVAGTALAQLESQKEALVTERKVMEGLKEGVKKASELVEALQGEVDTVKGELVEEKRARAEVEEKAESIKAQLQEAVEKAEEKESEVARLRQEIAAFELKEAVGADRVAALEAALEAANHSALLLKGQVTEVGRQLEVSELRAGMIAEVRAEAAMLVEELEDKVFEELREKEELKKRNAELEEESKGANEMKEEIAMIKAELLQAQKSLKKTKAARAKAEAAVTEIKSVVGSSTE